LKIIGESILMENGKRLFKQMKHSSKIDIEHLREFREGVRNELFYIIFNCCYLLYYIFSFSGKVFKSRREKGVLRKTLIEMDRRFKCLIP
jgi:hypothetical protein